MNSILIVDDSAICREPIAVALEQSGYTVTCAGSGAEALHKLRDTEIDLVLLDLTMPGLDGFSVLRAIRRNPQLHDLPVIVLTDKAERQAVVMAGRFGAQGYLLKSKFALDELLQRVAHCLGGGSDAGMPSPTEGTAAVPEQPSRAAPTEKPGTGAKRIGKRAPVPQGALAPSDLQPVITRDQLVELVNKGLELRPMGPTVSNVMAATGSASCSADDVARIVGQDQALSIRILKLANSSTYSRGRMVESVKDAVQRIGIHEVRSLVMTLGVAESYTGGQTGRGDPRMFWEHSIAVGLIATAIAKQRKLPNPDEFFLWGMLHDVGRLIMLEHVPEAYEKVWQVVEKSGIPLETAEAKLMLLDHCDILARALEHWQFPHHFTAPVVNHHQSVARIRRLGEKICQQAGTVALANRIAHALLLGNSGDDVIHPVHEFMELLELPTEWIDTLPEEIIQETHDLKFSMLARSTGDQWPDFHERIRERLETVPSVVFAGVPTEVSPYPMLFDRLKGGVAREPNLAVVHVPSADKTSLALDRLVAKEQELETGPLPMIVVFDRGQPPPDSAIRDQRNFTVLQSPVRIDALIQAIQVLQPQTAHI